MSHVLVFFLGPVTKVIQAQYPLLIGLTLLAHKFDQNVLDSTILDEKHSKVGLKTSGVAILCDVMQSRNARDLERLTASPFSASGSILSVCI